MGLYELVFTAVVLFPANLLLYRKKPPVGSFVAMNCLVYGAGRFGLDFLRATDRTDSDPRYLGLTLAHYLSLGIFVFGLVVALLARARKLEPLTPPFSRIQVAPPSAVRSTVPLSPTAQARDAL